MSSPPTLAELARARRAGWEDASRGLTVDDYPFEFADGLLLQAWLDGHDSATGERKPARAPSHALVAIDGPALAVGIVVAGASSALLFAGAPVGPLAAGLLLGIYVGLHIGVCLNAS